MFAFTVPLLTVGSCRFAQGYKGYGDLYKFVLEEEIDHGKR